MKSSLFTLFSSALVALASAYTQPVGDPAGNPIYKPGLQERVPVAQPYTITWTPTTDGTVTIVLLRGPGNNIKPMYPIAEGISNTGTYTWTPSSDLEDDVTHYGLQLIVDATGQYQYSTQFGVSNPGGSPSSSGAYVTPAYVTPASLMPSSSSTTYVAPVSSMPVYPSTAPCRNSSIPVSSATIKPQDAATVVYTNVVTITSCAATVEHCPARSTVSPVVSVPTYAAAKPSTYWGNNTMITTTPTSSSPVASTGFGTSTTASTPPKFTGAGDKVRVGCAMGAVMVAALALAL